MAAPRTTVVALLEREARQASSPALARGGDDAPSEEQRSADRPPARRLNGVWRQKVVHWYFTLVAALRRQHAAAAGSETHNPFDRASVHVTASLLDGYLASLPAERASRYSRDRPAYQLLATTCLLLGMRLAQHDQLREAREKDTTSKREAESGATGGLKRAKTHRTCMNKSATTAVASTSSEAAGTTPPAGVAVPNAATILRISAAPKSISEQHVLSMVREMTGSRAFPRSKVVTPLDFIKALAAETTRVSDDGASVSLGPADAEEASCLADAAVRNAAFVGCRPSVVACAAITLALARSNDINLSLASLRKKVHHSIFGDEDDTALQASTRRAESSLLACMQVRVPPSLNRHLAPAAHLIPLEDD